LFPNRGKYEQIHKDRAALDNIELPQQPGLPMTGTESNRLTRLLREYGLDRISLTDMTPRIGEESSTLTANGGPRSMLGVGKTRFSRSTDTARFQGSSFIGIGLETFHRSLGDTAGQRLLERQYSYRNRYDMRTEDGSLVVSAGLTAIDDGDNIPLKVDSDNSPETLTMVSSQAHRVYHNSLANMASDNKAWLESQGKLYGDLSVNNNANLYGGGLASTRDDLSQANQKNNIDYLGKGESYVEGRSQWVTMNYEKLSAAAKLRNTNDTKLLNFQLMSRGVDVNNATYEKGIILGDELLRFNMYKKGKHSVVDGDPGDGEFKDLIKFKIGDVHFEAYIDGISDSSSPGLATSNDSGVLLPRYRPESYSREISIEFKMIATNPDHLGVKWTKMKQLMKLSQPSGGNGTYTDLTVGDLYNELPVICTGFECGWDGETTWEIHDKFQVPIITTCSITFNVLTISKTFAVNPDAGLSSWEAAQLKHVTEG
jgi:hypothetical protein